MTVGTGHRERGSNFINKVKQYLSTKISFWTRPRSKRPICRVSFSINNFIESCHLHLDVAFASLLFTVLKGMQILLSSNAIKLVILLGED